MPRGGAVQPGRDQREDGHQPLKKARPPAGTCARLLGRRGNLRPVRVGVVGAAVRPAVGQPHDVVAGTGAERRAADVTVGPGDGLRTGLRVARAGALAARVEFYRPQVRAYRQAVEAATGAQTRAVLMFLNPGASAAFDVDG